MNPAGTLEREKGKGADLLKGTNKILTMLKSLHGDLEGLLHFFSQIKPYHILDIVSVITLGINTSQISSIYSATVGF